MSGLIIQAFMGPEEVNIGPCAWIDIFDNDERNSYHQGLVITGVISQILTLWLNLALMLTLLWKDENYRSLALFTIVSCLRKMAAGVASLPSFRFIDSWFKSNVMSCTMFAYYDSFFGVMEIEALTHVCIARFVMARYAANGWTMNKQFYFFFICSTVAFAVVYTFLPMFGIGGSFYYDFSCTTCTYEMIIPEKKDEFNVLFLFFLRNIKPVVFMLIMLVWAYYLEANICMDIQAGERKIFTRNVIAITLATLLCWIPLVTIRTYVVVGQLMYNKTDIIKSVTPYGMYIKWALLLNWVAPAFMVVVLMLMDKNVRYHMINLRACAKMAAELADREAAEKDEAEKQCIKENEKEKGKKKK